MTKPDSPIQTAAASQLSLALVMARGMPAVASRLRPRQACCLGPSGNPDPLAQVSACRIGRSISQTDGPAASAGLAAAEAWGFVHVAPAMAYGWAWAGRQPNPIGRLARWRKSPGAGPLACIFHLDGLAARGRTRRVHAAPACPKLIMIMRCRHALRANGISRPGPTGNSDRTGGLCNRGRKGAWGTAGIWTRPQAALGQGTGGGARELAQGLASCREPAGGPSPTAHATKVGCWGHRPWASLWGCALGRYQI